MKKHWLKMLTLPLIMAAMPVYAQTMTWTKVADEGGTFTATGTQTFRFGKNSSWVTKQFTNVTKSCSSYTFGSDPLSGVKKECDLGTVVTPAVSASLVPTRVSGTAPLAVLFDATATTNTLGLDSFRQLSYAFDFGDDRGLTWAVSGLPKNTENGGPVAAHVFDVAGTYSVKVRATDPVSGNYAESTVNITVNDPNTVYSGTKTVCVSALSNWSGCPSGAAHVASLPTGTAWNGKRTLLARGETFDDLLDIENDNSGVQVGAYGTGKAPIVNTVWVGAWRPTTANFATDVTVMDLAVTNGINQSLGKQVLLYRNDLTSVSDGHGIYIGGIGYWAKDDKWRTVPTSSFYYANQIFVVENKVTGTFNDAGYNLYGDAYQLALLGNVMGTSKYHTARITKTQRAIIAHNNLKGINPAGIYHSLKLHSGGLSDYTPNYGDDAWYSDRVVVSNNLFGNAADSNQWTVAICPENGEVAEGVSNVLVQSNTFIRNSFTVQDLTFGGRYLTYRSNVVNGGGTLWEGIGHDESLPADWKGPYYGY